MHISLETIQLVPKISHVLQCTSDDIAGHERGSGPHQSLGRRVVHGVFGERKVEIVRTRRRLLISVAVAD